jgi:hypothetical protein
MAEVYEEFSGSANYVSKERRRRGPLYLYICKMNLKSLCVMSLDDYFRE